MRQARRSGCAPTPAGATANPLPRTTSCSHGARSSIPPTRPSTRSSCIRSRTPKRSISGELPIESLGVRAVDDRTLAVRFRTPYCRTSRSSSSTPPTARCAQDFYESLQRPVRRRCRHDAVQRTVPDHEVGPRRPAASREEPALLGLPTASSSTSSTSRTSPNDANAVLNLYKDGKIATAHARSPRPSTTRWNTAGRSDRFNDGACLLPSSTSGRGA